MATRKRNPNPVYAVATASHEHGYGHLTIHAYEMFGYQGGTLKITCQSGGTSSPGETYAWDHGLANDYSVLGVEALKKGYWMMRRIKRVLNKEYDDHGRAENYATYVLRVLRAAGIRKIYLRPGVNSSYHGDVKTLPGFDPIKQGDTLLNELHNMEQAILSRS